MKPSEIKVGATYANRGAGRTKRKVLGVSNDLRPKVWWGSGVEEPPDEPGVEYEQAGMVNRLYISSFASWCGKEVK